MLIIEIIKAAVLGIIQGITEWLPVSSTGHLLLANQFLNLKASPEFMNMFDVLIQLGSILAVIVLFFHKLNPFSPKKDAAQKKDTWYMWLMVIIGIIPAGVAGVLFDDIITAHLETPFIIACTLIVFGVLFFVVDNGRLKSKFSEISAITWREALFIGAFQMLALVPGVSRSGATIIGALLIGATRSVAAEFSFFMSVPVMFGASALRALKFITSDVAVSSDELILLAVGFAVSFIVSLFVIKGLMSFIKKHDFRPFGWYRIALGLLVLIWFYVIAR